MIEHYVKIDTVEDAAKELVKQMIKLDSDCIGLKFTMTVKDKQYEIKVKEK